MFLKIQDDIINNGKEVQVGNELEEIALDDPMLHDLAGGEHHVCCIQLEDGTIHCGTDYHC